MINGALFGPLAGAFTAGLGHTLAAVIEMRSAPSATPPILRTGKRSCPLG